MNTNIFRNTDITKIYLFYVDGGIKVKTEVKMRFMDQKDGYFSATLPPNFKKPKRKISAELKVYTSDGVYQSNVTLIDTTTSINDVLYQISFPKKWELIQLRSGTRKHVELPFKIQYQDGYSLEGTTHDLAIGGISFINNLQMSSIYKKIPATITLEFPQNLIINFPDRKLETEVMFVRENKYDNFDNKLYSYRFKSLSQDAIDIIKAFLIKLD